MTDELSSEQEAAVRRLLAEARHAEPVPADVAARLDEVLEGLVADPDLGAVDGLGAVESDGSDSVTDLAGVRRRRRNAGRLLLAAAAVVIGGVAVGQMLGSAGLDAADDSGSAADTQADSPRDGADRDQTVPAEAGGTGGGAADLEDSPAAGSADESLLDLAQAPLSLTSDNFAADVRRELRRTAAQRRNAARANYDGLREFASTSSQFKCAAGAYGVGAKLPAYYDAEEAVLVLRRPRAGIQRADLLTCGTAVELNSVDLEAR